MIFSTKKLPTNPNALVVVAHPDDEILFTAGLMLEKLNWNWHVCCMTWQEPSLRYAEFLAAKDFMHDFGVNIKWWDSLGLEDKVGVADIKEWEKALRRKCFKPDIVFTHNEQGDYGSEHHVFLNKIVHKIYDNVWEFIIPAVGIKETPPFKKDIILVAPDRDNLDRKFVTFNYAYVTELTAWRSIPDTLTFVFKSGLEIFTK